jgi:hypothetical protein
MTRHRRAVQRNVFVPLSREAVEALTELARREYREPRAQAAILIVEGLRRSGFDPDPQRSASVAAPAGRQPS